MGIYGAINSAVSGLAAQATALENISGNVANSQTTGYKRLDTSFSDLVAGSGDMQSEQVAGSVLSTSRATNSIQGDITSIDVDTYLAINGDGYFVVKSAEDVIDGSTTFSDETFYTRAGDFEIDQDGYLVNSSGYYLQGFELDPVTGNTVGDSTAVIEISDAPLPASASTAIDYQANLPPTPQTNNYTLSADDLLDTSGTITATGHITTGNQQAFLDSSIAGGSTTIYDANGSPINVELRWAKTASDTWNLYFASDGDATDAYKLVGQAGFNASGAMNSLAVPGDAGTDGNTASATGITVANLTVNGVTGSSVNISFFGSTLTQFSDGNGQASSVDLDQNGYPAGELTSISVDGAGRVMATYTNSEIRALYDVPLATFDAEQNLLRVDGAAFAATPASGLPDLTQGGTIISNALEASNADIADEFSKLIITQQAYSANSRVVTSADEMLDDALNMIR